MTATIFWKLDHSRMYGNWVGRHEKVESKVNSGKTQNATYFTQQKPRKFQDWGWCWKQNEFESLVVSKQMSRFSSSVPTKDWRTVFPGETKCRHQAQLWAGSILSKTGKQAKICLHTECWHSNPIPPLVPWILAAQLIPLELGRQAFFSGDWPSPKGKDVEIITWNFPK